jgi:hypothetical protein
MALGDSFLKSADVKEISGRKGRRRHGLQSCPDTYGVLMHAHFKNRGFHSPIFETANMLPGGPEEQRSRSLARRSGPSIMVMQQITARSGWRAEEGELNRNETFAAKKNCRNEAFAAMKHSRLEVMP